MTHGPVLKGFDGPRLRPRGGGRRPRGGVASKAGGAKKVLSLGTYYLLRFCFEYIYIYIFV